MRPECPADLGLFDGMDERADVLTLVWDASSCGVPTRNAQPIIRRPGETRTWRA